MNVTGGKRMVRTGFRHYLVIAISIGLMGGATDQSVGQVSPDRPPVSDPPTPPTPPDRDDDTPDNKPDNRPDTKPDKNRDKPGGKADRVQKVDRDAQNSTNSVSVTITKEVVRTFESVKQECSKYDSSYRIDCLRQGIQLSLSRLPDSGDYNEVRRILNKTASKLGNIVSENADLSEPSLIAPQGANPHFKRRRAYTPIKRDSLQKAMREAEIVVAEAQAQLLRSSENSERRSAHYQQISIAVGSTKTLLRSS